jgi:hypothetical protein
MLSKNAPKRFSFPSKGIPSLGASACVKAYDLDNLLPNNRLVKPIRSYRIKGVIVPSSLVRNYRTSHDIVTCAILTFEQMIIVDVSHRSFTSGGGLQYHRVSGSEFFTTGRVHPISAPAHHPPPPPPPPPPPSNGQNVYELLSMDDPLGYTSIFSAA